MPSDDIAISVNEMAVVVTVWSILLSFAFSAAIGVFFGFYPARGQRS